MPVSCLYLRHQGIVPRIPTSQFDKRAMRFSKWDRILNFLLTLALAPCTSILMFLPKSSMLSSLFLNQTNSHAVATPQFIRRSSPRS